MTATVDAHDPDAEHPIRRASPTGIGAATDHIPFGAWSLIAGGAGRGRGAPPRGNGRHRKRLDFGGSLRFKESIPLTETASNIRAIRHLDEFVTRCNRTVRRVHLFPANLATHCILIVGNSFLVCNFIKSPEAAHIPT
jgi:hypothetical protein